MQKFKILGFSATMLGFALLLVALYSRFHAISELDVEGAVYPLLYLVVPFVFLGICGLVIGVVALSVPSLEVKTKKYQPESISAKMKERESFKKQIPEVSSTSSIPSSASSQPATIIKEREIITREVVLIPCAYCGGLIPQASTICPHCGAKRKI